MTKTIGGGDHYTITSHAKNGGMLMKSNQLITRWRCRLITTQHRVMNLLICHVIMRIECQNISPQTAISRSLLYWSFFVSSEASAFTSVEDLSSDTSFVVSDALLSSNDWPYSFTLVLSTWYNLHRTRNIQLVNTAWYSLHRTSNSQLVNTSHMP